MSSSSGSSRKRSEGLGWIEWLRGWIHLIYEVLFQKISARHLKTPLPLPPLNKITCIVTGSTSGIGLEIARQLASSGAHLIMAVRNTSLALQLIQTWRNESGDLNIEVMELDLLSLESVVKFTQRWNSMSKPLHMLINNAGIFSIGESIKFSKDGFETHLQVNHLAPSLLSILLLPSLIKGSPSRIINVNSVMHMLGFVDSEDMNFDGEKWKFTSLKGYANSKLAQVMFSNILHWKLPADLGVNVVCLCPGSVRTNVARDLPNFIQHAYKCFLFNLFNPEEGSRPPLYAATDDKILEYCKEMKNNESPACPFIAYDCRLMNVSKEAHNIGVSQKVWEKTLDMIGLPYNVVEKILSGEDILSQYDRPI